MIKLYDNKNRLISHDLNNFPDGQIQFKILHKDAVRVETIKASIPDSKSVDELLQAISVLKKYNLTNVKINYLYGARSDKDIADDYDVANVANIIIKQIEAVSDITIILNNNDHTNCKKIKSPFVSVLAPHCQLDYTIDSNYSLNWVMFNEGVIKNNYDLIIFPDESALTRFSFLADVMNYVVCEKHRDQVTGKIISHKIPELSKDCGKVIILDDLCDGGASYRSLKTSIPENIVADLFVFHGVFSNNALLKMLDIYNKVIVTNSLPTPETQKQLLTLEDQERVQILNVW